MRAGVELVEHPVVYARLEVSVAAVTEEAEIYVNPAAALDERESRLVIAHELLHVSLRHGTRRQGRDPYLWNVACDFVVDGWLVETGVGDLPGVGALYDADLKGESAEGVYDRIVCDMRRYRKLATLREPALPAEGEGLPDQLSGARDSHESVPRGAVRRALGEYRCCTVGGAM